MLNLESMYDRIDELSEKKVKLQRLIKNKELLDKELQKIDSGISNAEVNLVITENNIKVRLKNKLNLPKYKRKCILSTIISFIILVTTLLCTILIKNPSFLLKVFETIFIGGSIVFTIVGSEDYVECNQRLNEFPSYEELIKKAEGLNRKIESYQYQRQIIQSDSDEISKMIDDVKSFVNPLINSKVAITNNFPSIDTSMSDLFIESSEERTPINITSLNNYFNFLDGLSIKINTTNKVLLTEKQQKKRKYPIKNYKIK